MPPGAPPPPGMAIKPPQGGPVAHRRPSRDRVDSLSGPGGPAVPVQLHIPTESQELFEVLMARVRVHVVGKKLNWISSFAAFDKEGDGVFLPETFVRCLVSLNCPLSEPEINFLVGCLSQQQAGTGPE